MDGENILTTWILWQFWETPRFLFKVWNNYMAYAANFFSIGLLLRTFFAPWRRYNWRYPKGFDIVEFFNALISNFVSRILGVVMRIILIIMGIFFQAFVALAGLVVFIFWIVSPFIVISGLLFVFLI